MSNPFTEINLSSDLHSTRFRTGMTISEMQAIPNKTILDEIYLAYVERMSVFQSFTPVSLDLIQSPLFWMLDDNPHDIFGLQDFVWMFFADFVNYTNPIVDNTFNLFTEEDFIAVTGLHADGLFRRVRSWDGHSVPTYEYGLMQQGDVIGPWIYEDLQKAFSALWWIRDSGFGDGTGKYVPSSWWWWDGAYQEAMDLWPVTSWHYQGSRLYDIWAVLQHSGGAWRWQITRNSNRAAYTLSNKIASLHTADLYVRLQTQGLLEGMVHNPDGLPYTENILTLDQSWAEALDLSYSGTTKYGDGIDTCPLTALNIPPMYDPINALVYLSCWFLFKFNFTNRNP